MPFDNEIKQLENANAEAEAICRFFPDLTGADDTSDFFAAIIRYLEKKDKNMLVIVRLLNYFHHQTENVAALKQVREAISESMLSDLKRTPLLLRSFMASIELNRNPGSIPALNKFDQCYREVSQYRFLHKLAGALLSLVGWMRESWGLSARQYKANAALPKVLQDFREALKKPKYSLSYSKGTRVSAPEALVVANSLTSAPDTVFRTLNQGTMTPSLKSAFNENANRGDLINKTISAGFFRRRQHKDIQEVTTSIDKLPKDSAFDDLKSFTKARPHTTFNPQQESKDCDRPLDLLLGKVEKTSANIGFVASVKDKNNTQGYSVSFFSRLVDGNRVYLTVDSRAGKVEVHDNKQTLTNNLLSQWRENPKHEVVTVYSYTMPKPAGR